MANWSFLTNHARVLLSIAHDPGVRLRDIAASLGITERSAYGIVTDLAEVGYVVKQKDDRRNSPDPGAPAAARTRPAGTRRRLGTDTGNRPQAAASCPGSPRDPAMYLTASVPAPRREATP